MKVQTQIDFMVAAKTQHCSTSLWVPSRDVGAMDEMSMSQEVHVVVNERRMKHVQGKGGPSRTFLPSKIPKIRLCFENEGIHMVHS
jgi:hypothetical protein